MDAQRISLITLAVRDLEKSREFYSAIGWQEAEGGNDKIAFYKALGQYFALYTRDALTEDLCMPIHGRSTGNVSMSTNYLSTKEVDQAFASAQKAGAVIISPPSETHWGGYSGYFADPDGHLWEVAFNPFWTYTAEGAVEFDKKGD